MVSTKKITVVIKEHIYTFLKESNTFYFCDIEVPNLSLQEILQEDPEDQNYDLIVNKGYSHETGLFIANLTSVIYLNDGYSTEEQIQFLWEFFCDIGVLLHTNSPLIKPNMIFTVQDDGTMRYKNNTITMSLEAVENSNYLQQLILSQ